MILHVYTKQMLEQWMNGKCYHLGDIRILYLLKIMKRKNQPPINFHSWVLQLWKKAYHRRKGTRFGLKMVDLEFESRYLKSKLKSFQAYLISQKLFSVEEELSIIRRTLSIEQNLSCKSSHQPSSPAFSSAAASSQYQSPLPTKWQKKMREEVPQILKR